MNPGVGEEAGTTTRTLIEALKSTPAILALVLFNLAFMALVAYIQATNSTRWHELMQQTLQQCGPKT